MHNSTSEGADLAFLQDDAPHSRIGMCLPQPLAGLMQCHPHVAFIILACSTQFACSCTAMVKQEANILQAWQQELTCAG